MLSMVSGRQRAGKTYVCVELLLEYLKESKRHIFSDFPLNPDIICEYAADGKHKHPARYRSYLERLHLFMDFSGRNKQYYKQFKKANPDYCSLHLSLSKHKTIKKEGRLDLVVYVRDNPLILAREKLISFWNHTPANSVVFIDEAYEIFGALDQRSHGQEIRKQLLAYTRQHGHFKDDIYLISHKEGDIDKIIRNGIQRHYVVSNSKYENMFDKRIMQGLKWPIQFFMVKIYQMGDKKESDSFYYFPKQQIFKCYNSFSVSSSLNKAAASEEDFNTDAAVDHKANWKGFTRQFVPLASFFLCTGVGIAWFIYHCIDNYTSTTVSCGPSSSVSSPGQGGTSVLKQSTPTIKLLTPSTIVYSDKLIIKKGSIYHGYKVEKIDFDFVVLSRSGVSNKYSLAALRPEASAPGIRAAILQRQQQPVQQLSGIQSGLQPVQPSQSPTVNSSSMQLPASASAVSRSSVSAFSVSGAASAVSSGSGR